MSSVCTPIFRTGIYALDMVVFCVGGIGVTVATLIVAFVFLLLIFRR